MKGTAGKAEGKLREGQGDITIEYVRFVAARLPGSGSWLFWIPLQRDLKSIISNGDVDNTTPSCWGSLGGVDEYGGSRMVPGTQNEGDHYL